MDANHLTPRCGCTNRDGHSDEREISLCPGFGESRHREGLDDIDPDLYSQLRLLTLQEAGALTGPAVESLAHYRTQRTGPAFVRVKVATRGSANDRAAGHVRYTIQALLDWFAELADETADWRAR